MPDLADIVGNATTYISVIFIAVHTMRPENIAVSKPAWTTTNDSLAPPRRAVDGNPATFTRISTAYWPFLGIDLQSRVTLVTVLLRLWKGEYLFSCLS